MTVTPVAPLRAVIDPSPPRESAVALPRDCSRGGPGPGVTVVICSYTEARWNLLVRAVASAYDQLHRPAQIVVVVDHCPGLLRRARRELSGLAGLDDRRQLTVVPNAGRQGLSGARNSGVRSARSRIVAFLDDDAEADPTWLSRLCQHYEDPAVIGVGGQVVPEWESGRPAWFPPEFDWVVGCTYRGMPQGLAPIRNFLGANMSFRRDALVDSGGFSPDLGRVGSTPVGCEETELCIRLSASDREAVLLYDPNAVVHHWVPSSRSTWGYFRARCYSEGISKAEVRARAGAGPALQSERAYLLATIPTGVAQAVVRGLRGRPAGAVGAATIVAGVGATVWGYLVGRIARKGAAAPVGAAVERSRISLPVVGAFAALPVALILWCLALLRVDLARMSDVGLVSVLPVTFWGALVALTVGFGLAATRARPSPALLVGYVVVLILVLHATPTILYGTLRYAWAWKHVGVIDYMLRHGATNPKIANDLAAYQAWPGFFAGNALLIKIAGFQSALSYASWGPPFFNLLVLGPLVLIFRRYTSDQRLIWTAVWFFYLGSWVGQDYFSPQACTYFLYLVIIAVSLRWYSSSGVALAAGRSRLDPVRPLRAQPWRRASILAMLVVLLAAIATSHQLTPLMLITALTGLVLFRRCSERVLPLVMVALTVGWILFAARSFLATNFHYITASIGRPDANAQANLLNLSHASPGQVLVARMDRLLSASVWALAAIGVWRRRRSRQADLPLILLSLSPLPLVVANSYGGEMVFRVYLFALPFVAFFAAASLFPTARSGRSRPFPGVLIGVSLALLVAFLFSYYGKEQVNYFSPGEVQATSWLDAHAPAGSFIVGPSGDLPWQDKNVEFYTHYWFALDTAQGRRNVLADPVGSLSADLTDPRHRASYLVFTRAQAAEVDTTGLLPPGSVTRIEQAVLGSSRFRVVFHNPDATILVATANPRGPR